MKRQTDILSAKATWAEPDTYTTACKEHRLESEDRNWKIEAGA